MKKTIPNLKVVDIPFHKSISELSCEEKIAYGLIESTGGINEYRRNFMIGQGGSVKEVTWNRKSHWHNCCKSKVAWRHKTGCPKNIKNAPDDLSDLSDEPIRAMMKKDL